MSKKVVLNDDSNITVWCEGRYYDQFIESYRPVYSYSIETEEWCYNDNDIHGAINEKPNVDLGFKALLAFLIACVEASGEDSGNYNLFPHYVRDWALHNEEEIKSMYTTFC